ncbi:Hsp20/alpha crystallin family protein [Arachidicoccus terrestris]|uniref:Hsp20/alpha crystallin family protein n=1 Tax=Arachidicoccus terrestris TaxID=2875539 RepID=UPI001CC3332A|nr:Hsp20/alpha crystallin family protein [Arachidicoccus terrestris]UAY54296.1 Hsp20/alpha crystallin family protein [Arachidicoccus terrestris]
MSTLVKRNYGTLNNLFEEVFGGFPAGNFAKELHVPAVNIKETKEAFELEVAAPGLQKQDFKLNVDDNLLTISYDKQASKEQSGEDTKIHRQEFTNRSFKRTFTLDEKIDADKIVAKYENGILSVTLPKKEEVKITPKSIEIL